MMGQHDRSEALFYYFRLEDQVPETHLLRLIEKHISFAFVRERLKDSYSETGRPSIDPELLLRILLIGYLYGVSSERKLVEELRMHLAWRWFSGLGFDQEIPHHSTFSKNRHGRFQESKVFEQLFEQIVRQCVEVGLVQGKHLSVDGSFVSTPTPHVSLTIGSIAIRRRSKRVIALLESVDLNLRFARDPPTIGGKSRWRSHSPANRLLPTVVPIPTEISLHFLSPRIVHVICDPPTLIVAVCRLPTSRARVHRDLRSGRDRMRVSLGWFHRA